MPTPRCATSDACGPIDHDRPEARGGLSASATTAPGAGSAYSRVSPLTQASMEDHVSPTEIDIDIHEQTTRMGIHEIVRQLISHLGPTLVATLANVRDSKLPHKWSRVDGPTPRDEAKRRLMVAHRIWVKLSSAENDYVARNWFIGANPRLGEQMPAMCLREGKLDQVIDAADAFLEGTDG